MNSIDALVNWKVDAAVYYLIEREMLTLWSVELVDAMVNCLNENLSHYKQVFLVQ